MGVSTFLLVLAIITLQVDNQLSLFGDHGGVAMKNVRNAVLACLLSGSFLVFSNSCSLFGLYITESQSYCLNNRTGRNLMMFYVVHERATGGYPLIPYEVGTNPEWAINGTFVPPGTQEFLHPEDYFVSIDFREVNDPEKIVYSKTSQATGWRYTEKEYPLGTRMRVWTLTLTQAMLDEYAAAQP